MSEYLGQLIVVDNRAGANGGIGTAPVAKANPDGYTLLLGNSGPMTVNPNLYKKVPYDPIRDFTLISQGTVYWYVLVVPLSTLVKTLDDFVAMLKAKGPDDLWFDRYWRRQSPRGRALQHHDQNPVDSRSLHRERGRAGILAGGRGQTHYMFDTVVTAVPHIRSGRLKAIGVTALKRAEAIPEVPTLDELGLKGYEITQRQALVAPAGTPRPIIDKLHQAMVRALREKDVIDRIGPPAGNDLVGNTPEEFAQVIRRDLEKYAKLIREARIEPR